MFKKLGVVTVGVAAGLMVAAPFASASECHDEHESDHHSSHETTSDDDCNVTAGSAEANGGTHGDAKFNALGQLPVGGSNIGNITCSEILSNNLSNNHVEVL